MKFYRAESGFFKGLNPTMTLISMMLIIAFVLFGSFWTEIAADIFKVLRVHIT
jgi:hypothetical protein